MKNRINQKAFTSITILIAVIVGVMVITTATTGIILYKTGKINFDDLKDNFLKDNSQNVNEGEENISETKEELEKDKLEAELEKTKAETEKARIESEKLKAELEQINREEEQKQANKILLEGCLTKAKQTWDQRYLIILQIEKACKDRALEILISSQWTPEECVQSDVCTSLLLNTLPKAEEDCEKDKEENMQKWEAVFNQDKEDCYRNYP
jgi:hypothetical protein